MSRSLEAALVIPCTLIMITGGLTRQIPILRELRAEARSLTAISADEVHPAALYKRRERERGRCSLQANPQKLLESARLFEDLLFYRKRSRELQPMQPLPEVPGFPLIEEGKAEASEPPFLQFPQLPLLAP